MAYRLPPPVIQSVAKNPFLVPLGGRPPHPPMRAALHLLSFRVPPARQSVSHTLRPIASRVLFTFWRQKVNRKTATVPTRWTRRLGASPPVPRGLTVYAHEGLPPPAAWIRAVCATLRRKGALYLERVALGNLQAVFSLFSRSLLIRHRGSPRANTVRPYGKPHHP